MIESMDQDNSTKVTSTDQTDVAYSNIKDTVPNELTIMEGTGAVEAVEPVTSTAITAAIANNNNPTVIISIESENGQTTFAVNDDAEQQQLQLTSTATDEPKKCDELPNAITEHVIANDVQIVLTEETACEAQFENDNAQLKNEGDDVPAVNEAQFPNHQLQSELDSILVLEAESDIETKLEPEAELEVEVKPKQVPEEETEVQPNPEPELQAELKSESALKSEQQIEPKFESEFELKTLNDLKLEPKPDFQTDPEEEPKLNSESLTASNLKPEAEPTSEAITSCDEYDDSADLDNYYQQVRDLESEYFEADEYEDISLADADSCSSDTSSVKQKKKGKVRTGLKQIFGGSKQVVVGTGKNIRKSTTKAANVGSSTLKSGANFVADTATTAAHTTKDLAKATVGAVGDVACGTRDAVTTGVCLGVGVTVLGAQAIGRGTSAVAGAITDGTTSAAHTIADGARFAGNAMVGGVKHTGQAIKYTAHGVAHAGISAVNEVLDTSKAGVRAVEHTIEAAAIKSAATIQHGTVKALTLGLKMADGSLVVVPKAIAAPPPESLPARSSASPPPLTATD